MKRNPFIEISGRKVGLDYKPLVIAEIGINHGGSLKVAKEMVDSAYAAGVEVVKHQTHIVSDEMSSEAKKAKVMAGLRLIDAMNPISYLLASDDPIIVEWPDRTLTMIKQGAIHES